MRNQITLLQILTGNVAYDNSFAIYAERVGGVFCEGSPARFGQTIFDNGGLLDDCELFACNEKVCDSLASWMDGYEGARVEAAIMLIDEINCLTI